MCSTQKHSKILQNCTLNSCKEPKASESSACEWNMEEETWKLVQKDFRPNTYFFIGIQAKFQALLPLAVFDFKIEFWLSE